MKNKTLLLQSVSTIATASAAFAAGVTTAHAAPATDNGYTFSVQGGFLFGTGDQFFNAVEDDKTGSSSFNGENSGYSYFSGISDADAPGKDFGYNAAFTVTKQLTPEWDLEFGAAVNQMLGTDGSFSSFFSGSSGYGNLSGGGSSGYNGSGYTAVNSQFGFQTMDFAVGFSPKLDNNMDVKLFAGIRTLHFTNEESASTSGFEYGGASYSGLAGSGNYSYEEGYQLTETFKSEFFGAGPRIGIQASTRLGGSNFGLSGSLAGAAIIGHESTHYSVNGADIREGGGYSGNGGTGSSYSGSSIYPVNSSYNSGHTKTVLDIQAQAGVDYYLDDTAKLTVGYQAETLTNVSGYDGNETKTVSGPFLKFTGGF